MVTFLVGVLLFCRPAAADIVYLKNNVHMEGIVAGSSAAGVELEVNGGTTWLPAAAILRVDRDTPAQNAALRSRWRGPQPSPQDRGLSYYYGEWLTAREVEERERSQAKPQPEQPAAVPGFPTINIFVNSTPWTVMTVEPPIPFHLQRDVRYSNLATTPPFWSGNRVRSSRGVF